LFNNIATTGENLTCSPSNKRGLHHQDGSEGQALKGPLKRKTIVCIILSAASRMLRSGTLHIAIRAENAAIILSRLKHHAAPFALIKVLAGVFGHDLALACPHAGHFIVDVISIDDPPRRFRAEERRARKNSASRARLARLS